MARKSTREPRCSLAEKPPRVLKSKGQKRPRGEVFRLGGVLMKAHGDVELPPPPPIPSPNG